MSIRRTRQTLRSRYRSRTAARRSATGRNNPPAVNAMIAQLASAEGALTSAEGLATARHCGARKTELSVRLGVLKPSWATVSRSARAQATHRKSTQ